MKIIGHRGARALAPENTLAGLRKGISHDVDGVEFDVQVTADNIVVLSHDNTLQTADGREWKIRSTPYADLQQHFPDLCTLREALRVIDHRVKALIEVKPGNPTEPVVGVVRRLQVEGWRATDFTFLSFDFRILQELHAALPEIPIIVNDSWSSVRATWRARQLDTRAIDISHYGLWPGVIRNLARRGYQLYTYGLNDVAKASRWQDCGLYGVITDYPDKMRPMKDD